MNDIATAMAKIAGVRKGAAAALEEVMQTSHGKKVRDSFHPPTVQHYFAQASASLEQLKELIPALYGDFHSVTADPEDKRIQFSDGGRKHEEVLHYGRDQLERLVRDLDQILEIRANSELAVPSALPTSEKQKRVFVSHGRSNDWREVQACIEKDIGIQTLELAQEPSAGQTIIEKLENNASRCDSAVIVMTGDDTDAEGQTRARENVIHEIGFFQCKYGRARICLLHEEAVSIPTNLSGVVYVPFPKGNVSASFFVLARELKAMYKL